MWNWLEDIVDLWKSLNFFLRYFLLGALIVGVCIFFWAILKIFISLVFITIVGVVIGTAIYLIIKTIKSFR